MRHVMIADHDLEMFQAAKKALQHNFRISPLPGNNDLLDNIINKTADIYLLTITSTGACSFQTYEIMRNIPEIIGKPVIFLAKQNNLELEQRAIAVGAEDYIVYPITDELLLHRINNCLELAELRKERPYLEHYQDAIALSFAELVECRDITTGGHMKNTTKYFEIFLQEAMMNDQYKDIIPVEDIRDLIRSAALHDIGKIGINDEILRKESTLDFNEFEYMKTHTTLGKQAFEKVINETGGTKWHYFARDMAYCHHERWDGSGYPSGLKEEEIPLYARMLTIVDVYDALTSSRAYKEAFSHQKAMDIIVAGKGTMFDPDLVNLFIYANKQFEEVLKNKCDTGMMERV